MILAAALLVLIALGLFIAGLVTGVTVWYWACVAVSALAAVILFVTWRQAAWARARADAGTREPATAPAETATARGSTAAHAAEEQQAEPAEPAPAAPPAPAPPEPGAATAEATESADGVDPEAEDVDIPDLLLVVDMHDDVFVVDEHPRYHLADCRWLASREAIPMPVNEARTDGFTPCGVCCPDRHLAQVARARKASTS